MAVTSRFLTQGAMFALEQTGLLLHDAVSLYHTKSFASAVVLAAYAREELGRHRILLGLRDRVLKGEPLTIERIRDSCEDHVEKQRQGMRSTTIRAEQDSQIDKLLRAKMKDPSSQEYQEADAELANLDKAMQKRTPNARAALRIAALYIEPISESEWRRPAAHVSRRAARDFLTDAINDYSIVVDRLGTMAAAILKQDDPNLYQEIVEWTDRPALPYVPPLSIL